MGWASKYISQLKAGEVVKFRPTGQSMTPKIQSGQLCTVKPIDNLAEICVKDIVLCKVHGKDYLHLVTAIQDGRFQISNNHGHVNGWISSKSIFGILIAVEK